MNSVHQQHEDYCQSCSMPLQSGDVLGTEKNGDKSVDYCIYCYEEGVFKQPDLTMSDMIEVCVPHMVEDGMDEQAARDILLKQLPFLKRWSAEQSGDQKQVGIQPVRIEEKASMTIAGISAVTNNADELSGQGKLGALWAQFHSNDIMTRVTKQAMDGAIYGCYTDYENGAAGQYRVLIGARVQEADTQPTGIDTVMIPAATYAVFTTARGPIQEVVAQAWGAIWQWSATSGMQRTYSGDFEYYDERSTDPSDAQVDIYIAIKSA